MVQRTQFLYTSPPSLYNLLVDKYCLGNALMESFYHQIVYCYRNLPVIH